MSNWGDVKKKLGSIFTSSGSDVELGEDYVELEADLGREKRSNILVKPFTLKKYEDIKDVINAIREGRTISILNIAPLKEKDLTELKRAIDKVKKTVDASEGDIAGFGENWLVITPSFAKVWRQSQEPTPEPEPETF